ncbi:MAG: DUF6683 family protein [Erythrobacter sp.]
MRMRKWVPFAIGLALGSVPGAGHAQSFGMDYGYVGAPMSNFLSSSYLTQQVANDLATPEVAQQSPETAAHAEPSPPLIVPLVGSSRMPARLAEHYPAAQRLRARALFEQLLNSHAALMQRFGIPPGDLGAAMASLIAGSWMGVHDTAFPDEHFLPLVNQMRAVIGSQPSFAGSSEAERRDMYDQMAIIGMMLATTQMGLQQRPDAATSKNMQAAAAGYLQQLFKVPAARIAIGEQGVTVR